MPLLHDESYVNEHFQILVLATLKTQPKYGHVISKELTALIGKKPGPGTVYGALYRLVEKNHISQLPAEGRRKPFEITSSGLAFLALQAAVMQNVIQFILDDLPPT